jgi:hypothetical protein
MRSVAARPASRQTSTSSLAAVATGDRVRIQSIHFDAVSNVREEFGFLAGDVIHCRSAGRWSLLLDTPGGRTVSLDRDRVRFIQVSRDGTA